MAKRGRKPNTERSVRWRVEVRESLALKVELLLYDPLEEKVSWGARSNLINELLARWLEERQKAKEEKHETLQREG